MNIVRIVFVLVLFSFGIFAAPASASDWRESFDRLCGLTTEAQELTAEELAGLINESDELLTVIAAADSRDKKVFLFRLKKCRSFFAYMYEIKKGEAGNPVQGK